MNYEDRSGHPPDFEVSYSFYSEAEGGRRTGPPMQHYRCDWAYDGDDVSETGIYMIWPEFLFPNGEVVPEGETLDASGKATMWIAVPKMRAEVHRERISIGVRGFFMEGSKRVAKAVVTRVIGLHSNPEF